MDLYALLHLPRDASVQDVKASFRRLALVHHPDRQAGATAQEKASAAVRFAQIKEAYEVLSDDSKRTNYQRFGRSGGASGSGRYRSQSTASAGYDPFAYSSGRYQSAAPRRRGTVYQTLGRMAAGMTRADGLFHLALAGIFIFGGLFADKIGTAMWDSLNQGRGFDRIEQLAAEKKQAALKAIDERRRGSQSNITVDSFPSAPGGTSQPVHMPPSFASSPEVSAAQQQPSTSLPAIAPHNAWDPSPPSGSSHVQHQPGPQSPVGDKGSPGSQPQQQRLPAKLAPQLSIPPASAGAPQTPSAAPAAANS